MKRRTVQPGTLRFILIAIVFMLLADHFIFGGKRSYIENARTATVVERQEEVLAQAPELETPKPPPVRVEPPKGTYFEAVPEPKVAEKAPEPDKKIEVERPKLKGAKIAIVIDDLGMDIKHTKEVLDLPAPVTLAFLPYAPRVRELAAAGKAKGHELIIHTPMEAMDGKLNIGPGGLKAGMNASEFDAAFKVMLTSFDGYAGINNHMGSRLTQDKQKMDELMGVLAEKKLFFLDSKTIQSSVAAHEAAQAGVKYAERDVFLDHVETREFVDKSLAQLERTAARKGYAIAIGHPKSFTIEGLKAWIPTLTAKSIELVPVSDLLVTPKIIPVKEETVPTVDLFPEEPAPQTPNAVSAPAPVAPAGLNLPPPTQSPAP